MPIDINLGRGAKPFPAAAGSVFEARYDTHVNWYTQTVEESR